MKKAIALLSLIAVILLSGCDTNLPSLDFIYKDAGMDINGEIIYYHYRVREEETYCPDEQELYNVYTLESGKYAVTLGYYVDEGDCFSNYYVYNETEEGYETLASAASLGLYTVEDYENVMWINPIYITNIQYQNEYSLEAFFMDYARWDVETLLAYQSDYCTQNTCIDNQEFTIADFPAITDDLYNTYDTSVNNGVILVRLNNTQYQLYLEPTGTERYQYPLGYTYDTNTNNGDPVEDTD